VRSPFNYHFLELTRLARSTFFYRYIERWSFAEGERLRRLSLFRDDVSNAALMTGPSVSLEHWMVAKRTALLTARKGIALEPARRSNEVPH
jgi:hypothetical protein